MSRGRDQHQDCVPKAEEIDASLATWLALCAGVLRDATSVEFRLALSVASLQLDCNCVDAQQERARALADAGRTDPAREVLLRLWGDPRVGECGPDALADLAETALDIDEPRIASEIASKVIGSVPSEAGSLETARAHVVLGRVKVSEQAHAAAASLFERAAEAAPYWAAGWAWLAHAQQLAGAAQESRRTLERAVSRGVHDAHILRQIARLDSARGQRELARTWLLRAALTGDTGAVEDLCVNEGWGDPRPKRAEAGPGSPVPADDKTGPDRGLREVLAWYLYACSRRLLAADCTRSARYLRAASELMPAEPHILRDLGIALQETGETDEAVRNLLDAARRFQRLPESVEATLVAASVLTGSGAMPSARDAIAAARSRWPRLSEEAPAYERAFSAAEVLAAGKLDLGLQMLGQAHRMDRVDPTIAGYYIDVLLATRHRSRAVAVAKRRLSDRSSPRLLRLVVRLLGRSAGLQEELETAYIGLSAQAGDLMASWLLEHRDRGGVCERGLTRR